MNTASPGVPWRSSLALRLALASALFGLAVAVGAILVGFWTLSQQLDERTAAQVQGRRELLVRILADIPAVEAVRAGRARFEDLFFGHDDLHLAVLDTRTGQVLAVFSDVAAHSVHGMSHAVAKAETVHGWVNPAGDRFSGIHGTASLADGHPVDFYLSVDRRHDEALLAGFVRATLVALPLLLLLVALGAGLVARMGLAPLRRLNLQAAAIGTQSLHQRLSVAGLPGELAELAEEFNQMLQRIDDGYRQLQEFSGDLAHEMRTPVATLIGRTQVALSQQRSAAELREVLEGNEEELERLSTLIGDMLFVARTEHDAAPLQIEPVDLVREAQRVAEYLSLVADEKQVQLAVEGSAPAIAADRLMVQRAITNLVSNAVRHASPGSTAHIAIEHQGDAARVAVTNEGDTIPAQHLERVFDRFWRADSGRGRSEGGSGLGLAIVRSIMKTHGGTIQAQSGAGRTTFTLQFPVQRQHAAPDS